MARVVIEVTLWSRATRHEVDPDRAKRHDRMGNGASEGVKWNEPLSHITCLLESLFPHFCPFSALFSAFFTTGPTVLMPL
jgi:hypothetical protein